MSNSDIVSNIDTTSIVKVATKIDNSVLSYAHLTYMEEFTSSMYTGCPPILVFRTFLNRSFEAD